MAEKINLDALIPRADLQVEEDTNLGTKKATVSIPDITADAFFLLNLNKPDFQRETTEWDNRKVCTFIESFVNNELIPALILWQSSNGNVFVIDGAHRLSSLIAWINDDYGDGIITRKFFKGNIPDEQIKVAVSARRYIENKIGPYKDYKNALITPDAYDAETIKKARVLSSAAIQLQWVQGDVSSAENSFLKINQQGASINKTELSLIKSRKKATCISARAVMRMGLGHKYWSNFTEDKQREIEDIARELYEIMFIPTLNTPIKTTDIPMCGKHSNTSLPLIFEFIQICNSNQFSEEDLTGDETIQCLKQSRKIARLINSNHPSSLGMHPLIYFYAKNGSFSVSSFYAFVCFVMDLEEKNQKEKFIRNRESFEHVFYNNNHLIQIIARKYRTSKKAMDKIKDFFFEIVSLIDEGVVEEEIINNIRAMDEYKYLPETDIEDYSTEAKSFNTARKSIIFIQEAVQSLPKCKICKGYVHKNAISIDHINRIEDGGNAETSNGQLTHPYCNTGYKN